jgi:serine/threonine protein kinase
MPARYPEIVEYNEAVQNPAHLFRDPELRRGHIELNSLGLPLALSGGFALTYMMRTGRRKLAVRCFLREIPAVQQKYAAIAGAVRALGSGYFVDFEYLDDGIALRGGSYPVVKMDWADGDTLGVWLDRHHSDRRRLARLREAFAALAAYLERQGIAHGDIQNGNVIVSRDGVRLVDYDGVYVPGMPAEFGCEVGHRHFQHPLRTPAHFGPAIDRFAFIVVDLSLAALIEDPSLYPRFRRGGEAILFHAGDFLDPGRSELFRLLSKSPDLARATRHLAAICRADISVVPNLADYRAGRNIPSEAARPRHAAAPTSRPPSDTGNRRLLARLIGDGDATAPAADVTRRPVSNRAIVQALRAAAPTRPLPARSPQAAARSGVRPAAPGSRPRHIPPTGSFVIHPRIPTAPPTPPPEPPQPKPRMWWERVLRFLGIDA